MLVLQLGTDLKYNANKIHYLNIGDRDKSLLIAL